MSTTSKIMHTMLLGGSLVMGNIHRGTSKGSNPHASRSLKVKKHNHHISSASRKRNTTKRGHFVA